MFTTPRGTQDILPEDWPYWEYIVAQAEEVAGLYGYKRIATPTFGPTSLFARTSGEGTDIVDKEMYTFEDRDGDSLTLRPEGTAPVMRAYLQHGMNKLPQPVKLFYAMESMFRYDRPQRGRLREHHQFGCEAMGVEDAFVDVELIALLDDFYRRLCLDDLALHVNSIGDAACRPAYVADLVRFLEEREGQLADRDRERLRRNPLRVLDSKEPETQPLLESAPRITEYLCDACRAHWDKLRRGLDLLGIRYTVDPRLVRGLDYYTRTAFEFIPPGSGGQGTVGGGGRYDGLSEALGGPPVPGIGFGTGIERLVLNMQDRGVQVPQPPHPAAYVAHLGEETEGAALQLAQRLRREGIPAEMAFGNSRLKVQLRHAAATGARYAAILGEDELVAGELTIRDLQAGEQRRVPLDEAARAVSGTTPTD